jgi:hypothetical protein
MAVGDAADPTAVSVSILIPGTRLSVSGPSSCMSEERSTDSRGPIDDVMTRQMDIGNAHVSSACRAFRKA